MRCKYVILTVFAMLFFSTLPHAANAVPVEAPPADYSPAVFITALQVTSQLDFIELHNDTSSPVDLSRWKVVLSAQNTGSVVCEVQLGHWLLPDGYVVATQNNAMNDTTGNVLFYEQCTLPATAIGKVALLYDGVEQETIAPLAPSIAYVRKGLTKTYRTGDMTKDFYKMSESSARKTLYAGEWYEPPQAAEVQFTEILAHSRDCSPIESSTECGDYVKLYNPTNQPIDLSQFRLRSGYRGQNSSASNTYVLGGILQSGQSAAVSKSADGRSFSLTNSGGFVWLEDAYGITQYDATVQEYADAGSETKTEQSWAYDETDGAWKWGIPSPNGKNQFPVTVEKVVAVKVNSLTPCRDDQYRSEETNRCRNNVSVASSLTPCKEDQYRSEETNRCRSLATTASATVPCKEGQERHPDTNRCRNVVGDVPDSAFAVEPVVEGDGAFTGWWMLGGVGALAAGRAGWEWRSEMLTAIRKIGSFFTSGK